MCDFSKTSYLSKAPVVYLENAIATLREETEFALTECKKARLQAEVERLEKIVSNRKALWAANDAAMDAAQLKACLYGDEN